MSKARVWTCQRSISGVVCKHVNPKRRMICESCGKRRPATKKPAHMSALDQPYEWWVQEFGEICGVCGVAPKSGKRLYRDHDHTRGGHARGLLCFRDNTAIRVYMTLDWMRRAVFYLERAEERIAKQLEIMDDGLSSDEEVDTAGHSAA